MDIDDLEEGAPNCLGHQEKLLRAGNIRAQITEINRTL